MAYLDLGISPVHQKYLAEFFDILERKIRNRNPSLKDNLVVNIMNKYPIMD
jgi:hypothetical protein